MDIGAPKGVAVGGVPGIYIWDEERHSYGLAPRGACSTYAGVCSGSDRRERHAQAEVTREHEIQVIRVGLESGAPALSVDRDRARAERQAAQQLEGRGKVPPADWRGVPAFREDELREGARIGA